MATASPPARAPSTEPAASAFDRTLAADVQALRAVTAEVPTLAHTERALRDALLTGKEKGGLMTALVPFRRRPRLFTAALAGGLLTAVLLWPVSYERTVGHTVTLSIAGDASAPKTREQIAGLAARLRRAVGAGGVRVTNTGPAAPLVLTARVPSRSTRELERRLGQLTAELRAEHLSVTQAVTARTEHHTGRVYAMALDKLIDIRVDTTGKTDSQVETEIRDQLTRSGMTPDTVQFQRTGDESEAQIDAHDDDHVVRLVRRQKGGPSELVIEAGGLDTERTPGMTDDQLRDKILRQLTARGVTATVTVHGDQIEIRAQKEASGAAP